MKKLILIDSHALIHRAYHALPPLTTPGGEPINAVYGFTSILLRILRELKPDYIAAAFDLPGPTFRHVAYERYKAQRPETPSDMRSQFSKVREVLDAFRIPIFEKEGYEADDIIGTIVKKFEKNKEVEIIIVTGDLDTLQLIKPRVKVYAMKKGISETVIYNAASVRERYGLEPSELVDFKGLKGDPSDNIPGIKGIGEKTAGELIKQFGSLEALYKSLKRGSKKVSPALAEKLRAGEEDAKFSRELARIETNVPIKLDIQTLQPCDLNSGAVRNTFLKFGFMSLLKRLEKETPARTQVLFPNVSAGKRPLDILNIYAENDLRKFREEVGKNSMGLLVDADKLLAIERGGKRPAAFDQKILASDDAKLFFENGEFYVHDAKTIIHFLRAQGVELGAINPALEHKGGVKFDTMLAAYLTEGFTRDFSYPAIAARELGRFASENLPEESVHFFEIAHLLEVKLAEGKLRRILEEIELPLARVLADMEERGIALDGEFLKKLSAKAGKEITRLINAIHKDAEEEFNLNSSQQLSRILFEKLKLKTYGLRKTEKGGVISTSASELEKLKDAHPIIPRILEYREYAKLKSTYIDALPLLVNARTGRVHTTFNQTGTATGRLSSFDPNLQNIPIMSELGREIRKAFIVEKGFLLVSFDYSQIELRVAAHLANDEKMIEAFRRGMDIHALTAAEVYNVPLEKVTPDLRRNAKTLNFGILYGMGSRAFSEATGMTREEAKRFIDEYFRNFSGIREYIERTKRFAEENGYVETLFGRRRYIPEIQSPNWQLKREAERMAVNMPVQGTATGDIIKMAMIEVDKYVKKEKLANDVRMLLQVHDELLFEIKKDLARKIAPQIKKIMESAAELKAPLAVNIKIGKSWGEQKSYARIAGD